MTIMSFITQAPGGKMGAECPPFETNFTLKRSRSVGYKSSVSKSKSGNVSSLLLKPVFSSNGARAGGKLECLRKKRRKTGSSCFLNYFHTIMEQKWFFKKECLKKKRNNK